MVFAPPSGPGVRLDTGVEPGSVIGSAWDPLLASLIVTGVTRKEALERAARALAEFRIEGMATSIPLHRAIVEDRAFAPRLDAPDARFTVHNRWIETEFVNDLEPFAGQGAGNVGSGLKDQRVSVGCHRGIGR